MSSKLFTALILLLVSPYFLERSFSLEIHVNVTGNDKSSCLNGIIACKTLQYVLNWLPDINSTSLAVHIYIHYNQTIRDKEETIRIEMYDYDELSITGVETTGGIPIYIQAQNLSGGIEFWSDSEYVLMNDFINTTTVRLSNLNFVDLPIRFTNLSQVYLNQSVFLADCELDDDAFDPQSSTESAGNSSGLLSINGVLDVSINEVDFSNYSTVVIADASNILVINTTFTQTKINCTTAGNGTDWSFMHSTFQEDTINGSNLLTLHGAVNSISIVYSSFINNSNHYGLILLSSIGLVGSFKFHNNNVENNSLNLLYYSIDLYGSSDECQVVSNISFYDNTFSENSGKRCLIGMDTCCRTQNKYQANHFLNNKFANMNIKSGNGSIHTLSNTVFDSNTAINTLVTFGIAEPCKDSATEYTILAEDLEFTENSFYVTVQEELQDPSAMTIGSENNDKRPILLSMGNLTFCKNYGTALTLFNVNITQLLGDLNFTLNTGNFGGGMLLYKIYMSKSSIESEINMTFANNTAKFGGAVYIMDSPCFLNESKNCMIHGIFTGNKATVEGDTIYSQLSHCCEPMNNCNFTFHNITSDHPPIVSLPNTITISAEKDINSNKSLSAFAGKNVELQFSLKDCQGTPVMCTAKALALCGEDSKPYSCAGYKDGFKFELDGPVYVKLQSGFVNTESNLSISRGINDDMLRESFQGLNPKLYFQCRNHRGYDLVSMTKSIAVQLEDCPKGYNYQDTDGFCECSAKNTTKYFCDFKSGTICVKKGYWIGYETSGDSSSPLIVTKCTSLNCNFNNTNNCSELDHLTDYVHVNLEETMLNEDSRCIRRHSGFLCSECMSNTSNSFDTYYCIEDSKCKEWHKPVLLIFSIMWPIVYGFFLLFMVPRTENGVGSFFCPFFFLAVLEIIVKEDSFDDYNELQIFASILVSTFLLRSRALGLLEWCFFSMGGPMWIWFYNYSSPVIIFMFLIIVFLVNRCSKRFLRLQTNPVMIMSITLLITFWSLAFTSITLITPMEIDGLDTRLEVQPTQSYLKYGHIFIFIVSVTILMCLAFVTLLLLFSPFGLGYLTKIKPFLDEFYHCYKIKYRWFSGLYFLSWIILSACKVSQQPVVFTSILFSLLFLQWMCQPYKKDWMNKSDSFFMVNLVMIVSIDVVESNKPRWLYVALKYITVLLPLLYITLCSLYMVGKIFISCCQFIRKFSPRKGHPQIFGDNTNIANCVFDHRATAKSSAASSCSNISDDSFAEIEASKVSSEGEPLLFNAKNVRDSLR